MLPRQQLLKDCKDPSGMESLLRQADEVLRTWQPSWSPFISAPLQEEALRVLRPLTDLQWQADGGHPNAERQRLRCSRCEDDTHTSSSAAPIHGLLLEGNFLFDPVSPTDILKALEAIGAQQQDLGDIWVRGDRGAQALCTPELAAKLNGCYCKVREVEINCEAVAVDLLQPPSQRLKRRLSSVEASCRLDAIASAGFGLSRAKIVNQIKEGRLRLNWEPIRQTSRALLVGDRLQLQDRGTLEVLSLEMTKRQRWRVEMLRR
ncbi:MAG: photosystem II S4 domain protein [Prochlorococcus sp.]|nr:photosystem II S4 domain protein [Prochlorococcaceae cyanobacterium ETNP14_MAG_4]HJM80752.1 photosystem II S4 domain protein [Prochlorococcaceae cyanobacterium Fu_MAG_72]|tara:strand:+ start:4617 stop:5402 length:786 start_codon:yes stop_codon:yes gene_type:complete